MSIIGEAALSAFFEVLFEKLTSSDVLKIFKQERLHADLKKWKTMLLKIRAVLDDAEEKQMTSKLVKIWLDELEDLAYDADDILDECATEALRRMVNAEAATSLQVRYESSSLLIAWVSVQVLLFSMRICGPRLKRLIQDCKEL